MFGLPSSALSVSLGFTPAVGNTFTIVEALAGINGTFNGLPQGAIFAVGSTLFQIHYTTTTVTLTDVGATATHFSVSAPPGSTAGAPLSITVTALDQANHQVPGYRGTVHFTSTDNQ